MPIASFGYCIAVILLSLSPPTFPPHGTMSFPYRETNPGAMMSSSITAQRQVRRDHYQLILLGGPVKLHSRLPSETHRCLYRYRISEPKAPNSTS
jgi:hypothetical protein